jgi:hypothetical protein
VAVVADPLLAEDLLREVVVPPRPPRGLGHGEGMRARAEAHDRQTAAQRRIERVEPARIGLAPTQEERQAIA